MKQIDLHSKAANPEYIFWIDLMKGSAIIGIVLFHLFQNYPDPSRLVENFAKIGAQVGFAGVDIFFLIAGFNISYSFLKKGIHEFKFFQFNWSVWLISRCKRLYPTYLLACIFVLLTYFVSGYKICNPLSFDFWLSITGWAGYLFQCLNPGFWFFTVILEAYLITPILFSISNGRPGKLLTITLAFAGITKLLCYLLPASSPAYYFVLQNNFIGSYIGQYGLGLYLGSEYFTSSSRFSKRSIYFSFSLFFLALIIYLQLSLAGQDIRYMEGFDLAFTPAFFFIGYYVFEKAFLKVKSLPVFHAIDVLLRYVGQRSYQVYLVHQPILFVILAPLTRLIGFDNHLETLLVSVLALIVIILYVYLFICLEQQLNRLALKKSA